MKNKFSTLICMEDNCENKACDYKKDQSKRYKFCGKVDCPRKKRKVQFGVAEGVK